MILYLDEQNRFENWFVGGQADSRKIRVGLEGLVSVTEEYTEEMQV